jgi:hypothetical protein
MMSGRAWASPGATFASFFCKHRGRESREAGAERGGGGVRGGGLGKTGEGESERRGAGMGEGTRFKQRRSALLRTTAGHLKANSTACKMQPRGRAQDAAAARRAPRDARSVPRLNRGGISAASREGGGHSRPIPTHGLAELLEERRVLARDAAREAAAEARGEERDDLGVLHVEKLVEVNATVLELLEGTGHLLRRLLA